MAIMGIKKIVSKPFFLATFGSGCCIFGLLIFLIIISGLVYLFLQNNNQAQPQTSSLNEINNYLDLYKPNQIASIEQITEEPSLWHKFVKNCNLILYGDFFIKPSKTILSFSPEYDPRMKELSLVWRNLDESQQQVLNFYGNQFNSNSAQNMLFTATEDGVKTAQANIANSNIWVLLWDNEKTADIDVLRVIIQYPVN